MFKASPYILLAKKLAIPLVKFFLFVLLKWDSQARKGNPKFSYSECCKMS